MLLREPPICLRLVLFAMLVATALDFHARASDQVREDAGPDVRPLEPRAAPPEPMPPKLERANQEVALKSYATQVARLIGKAVSERDYPRIAREQGWQGSTKVLVEMGRDGLLKRISVSRSSGFSLLDDIAVSKVREIQLPEVPGELRERAFSFEVPFKFALRKNEQRPSQDGGAASKQVPKQDEGVVLPGPSLY
jgi:TonB family protein